MSFTRQLVFRASKLLNAKRSGQQHGQTSYQISTQAIATASRLLIIYASETDLYNNDVRTYALSQQNGQQVLVLMGERVPVGGGTGETYHWIDQ